MAGNQKITWEFLLAAYASGYFPMADSRDSPLMRWICPEIRGILPLDEFHVPSSLGKFMKKSPFTITTDIAFPQVIHACANITGKRQETWINGPIIDLYCDLWKHGFAHSVECWQESPYKGENPVLCGGLYGVAIGGAFFGESMFSTVSNASKVALAHLAQLLKGAGYLLLDTQFTNDHLKQFGVQEIPRDDYMALLKEAIGVTPKECF